MKEERLIYSASEKSSDMLYFLKMNIPDSIFAFTLNEKKCAILSPLEIGRAKAESDLDIIFPSSQIGDFQTLLEIFKKEKVKALQIPKDFPANIYKKLLDAGFKLKISDGDFFPQRRFKTNYEIAEIKKANNAASASYERVWQILKESKIEKNFLKWRGSFLSSEILKYEIATTCLAHNAESKHTIAAAGKQACDPHCEGYGKIGANQLIVLDIFPRMLGSGYFGDMTRTFIKGRPNALQEKLVNTVLKAQKLALSKITEGVFANEVHETVNDFFLKNGYKTEYVKDAWQGFFHSTGHGLGLDIHEEPRLGLNKNKLIPGEVITVEPGLYYPEIGACRIEDNVCVTADGYKKLSNFHYNWVID